MNLTTWSDFFRIVIIIGSTLAVIGTIGHYAVGKILDRQKNQRIEDLEKGNSALKKELEETAKLAEPVRLTLEAAVKHPEGEGLCATIFFKASKNESLGRLEFTVTVINDSNHTITKLWPSLKGGAFQTGDKSFQKTSDSKSATLVYIPLGVEIAAFDVSLTGPAMVRITGNRLREPCNVTIQ